MGPSHISTPQHVDRAPAAATGGRDLRLDLFRGLALWFIYLDHIPGNTFDWLTLRNYGFSDTTEIFFFVSGYTCAIAYGAALDDQGAASTIARILRRAVEIYVAFVLLIVVYLATIVLITGAEKPVLDATNTASFFSDPGGTILHIVQMRWMPVNTDVLASFALLHALFVPLLFALRRAPNTVLILSIALYALVQVFGFNIPNWPKGEWFFNPFAWQVLFVAGAWIAFGGAARLAPLIAHPATIVAAIFYVIASLIIALGWKFEPLHALVPEALAKLIYPMDKSTLSPFRVFHFLALAVIAMQLMPPNWRGLAKPPLTSLIRCGEHSLAIYAAGVILSFVATQVLAALGGGLAAQALVSLTGIVMLVLLANGFGMLTRHDKTEPKLF